MHPPVCLVPPPPLASRHQPCCLLASCQPLKLLRASLAQPPPLAGLYPGHGCEVSLLQGCEVGKGVGGKLTVLVLQLLLL